MLASEYDVQADGSVPEILEKHWQTQKFEVCGGKN